MSWRRRSGAPSRRSGTRPCSPVPANCRRVEPIESPSPPGEREIRVVAGGLWDQLPSGYRTQAEDARTVLLESGTDRARADRPDSARAREPTISQSWSRARAWPTRRVISWRSGRCARSCATSRSPMGHSDTIDYESLTRELLAGAHQWRIDDWASAVNRLRAAFEILTQARERFYPVDAYLIDLCLIDPAMTEGVLADPLGRPIAISFVMPAQAIENQALHDPERVACAAAGNQRRLGRCCRRHVCRGGRRSHAARVDPLAIPPRE